MANGLDPGWEWGNRRRHSDAEEARYGAVRADSSLLLGVQADREAVKEHGEQSENGRGRRENSTSTITNNDADMGGDTPNQGEEERNSLIRPSLANHRLQSERQLGQKALQNSSQAYDKQLLSKIGGPSTANRPGGANFPQQEGGSGQRNAFHELSGQLKPLSVPSERRYSAIESPVSRWPSANSSGLSPGGSGFRSPMFEHGPSDNLFARRSNTASTPDTVEEIPTCINRSHRGSDDQGVFMDHDFAEEHGMRDLHIHDRSPSGSEEQGGKKRRADSPPVEAAREDRERVPTGGPNDLYRRRSQQMLASRNSPISRFQGGYGSVSSTSSLGQRTGSLASSWNLSIGSSVTSYSGERLSPGAMSPSVEAEFGPVSPYATNRSLNPSPRGSLSKNQHQRHLSENERPQSRKMSADGQNHSRQSSISKIQGLFICECCPKKPKKFDSEDELRIHELEKQYQCQYCPNRFKNKNEAERHQNSLHLRRHSWSCAALAGVQAAFHPSTIHPTTFEVCGYCGEEFPNPANWDARAEHLNHVHKFGECNQAKKFYRADHFRQHLKHSHAGTSGKWTNMLENACMKDEPAAPPPPLKDRMGSVVSVGGLSAAPTISSPIAGGAAMVGGPAPAPASAHPSSTVSRVIDEAHDES